MTALSGCNSWAVSTSLSRDLQSS